MVLALLSSRCLGTMNSTRIQKLARLADLTWSKTVVLAALGMLIGLGLALSLRLPVS